MGSPVSPTAAQAAELNGKTALEEPEHMRLANGSIRLQLAPNALLLVTVEK
jgi:hypothetical protein